jgi:hypothetical protein
MAVPIIAPKTTKKISTVLLDFDPENPRLMEDGTKNPSEEHIIGALAETADLSEVVESIAANGYFDIEPLIVQRVKDRFRVLEGNRRLAAIRLIQKPALAKTLGISVPDISQEVLESIKAVTVYAVENAAQARDYIGFKHVNGPHRWDALAKARFAAAWYRKERKSGLTLEKIAQRLGDRHDTVVRLVNGVFVLDQAEEKKVYDLEDRYPGRKFAFSHLYTALTRPGYREFLGLPEEWRDLDPTPNPVPAAKLESLQKFLIWLYGSKSDDIAPVITSQNPHIKQLGAVLQNARARSIMMMRNNLQEAYAQVESKESRFESSLINAKQESENALSQISGYDPSDLTLLEIGEELQKTSDALYSTMSSMAEKSGKPKAKK